MYTSKFKNEFIDELFKAILLLDNVDDCYRFFEDVCTVGELQEIAQRLAVAKMLQQSATYSEIVDKTGASTATISRVKKSLFYGADGYKLVLKKLSEESMQEE